MRFLLSFVLAMTVCAAVVVILVTPPEQLRGLMDRLPTNWLSGGSIGGPAGGDQSAAAAGVSAQALPAAAPTHERIRKADGVPVGDWLYDCDGDKAGQRPCVIANQIRDATGRIVFSWLIGVDSNGRFQAVWQTPTGVLVNRGIVLDAGTEKPIALPYTACVAGFCEAVANLAPDFVETLLNTKKATATVYAVSGEALAFTISVDGLADGILALRNRSRQG